MPRPALSNYNDEDRDLSAVDIELHLKVVPGSSRDQLVGWLGDELKVKVTAAPDRGAANKALVNFLATVLRVHPRHIKIARGHQSMRKQLLISGLNRTELSQRLAEELQLNKQ